jgi:hypothetical protein
MPHNPLSADQELKLFALAMQQDGSLTIRRESWGVPCRFYLNAEKNEDWNELFRQEKNKAFFLGGVTGMACTVVGLVVVELLFGANAPPGDAHK